jgi:hypothetical protein
MFALLLACAPDDGCDAMCVAALDRYGGCIEEAGLTWGESVGYTSAADFTDWCETWVWEARQTGLATTCEEKRVTFTDGTCDDYYDAWTNP